MSGLFLKKIVMIKLILLKSHEFSGSPPICGVEREFQVHF